MANVEDIVEAPVSSVEFKLKVAVPIIAVCFLIVVFDGMDTISITFVAPTLADLWGLSPSAMTSAFLATSLGAVVGYMIGGPLALHWGPQRVALASVALFGIGTMATVFATGVASLAAIRLVTAVGLGAALPIAVATAANAVSAGRKSAAAILTASGLSFGGVVAGLTGIPLMRHFGWTSVFVVGGLLPLLLLPAVFKTILDTNDAVAVGARPMTAAAMWDRPLIARTLLLWLFSFLVFVDTYALLFWLPTMLTTLGIAKEQAPASAAAFAMGGLIGDIALAFLISALTPVWTLALSCVVGILFVNVFGLTHMSQSLVLPLVVGMGAGFIPCCVGQSALAVSFYPPYLRSTGVGWAAAVGRIGSILGPAVGGLVLFLGWSPQEIVLTATIPAIGAIGALVAISRL